MFSYEKKFLEWVQKHIFVIFLIFVTIISVVLRYSVKDFVSKDFKVYLLPWYEEIQENGGLAALDTNVGTYNMLFQFLIALLTYLPINPLTGYKVLSCVFDYGLAVAMAALVHHVSEKDKKWNAGLAYTLSILSPIVFLNSSLWGQCDVIYTFFVVLSLLFFMQEKYVKSFIFFGIAFAFKLQAAFVLPAFLFVYFVKKKFSILYFAIIPVVMCVTSIPNVIMGRKWTDVFTIYVEQTDVFPAVYMNYPTFWTTLLSHHEVADFDMFKTFTMLFTLMILAVAMIILFKEIKEIQSRHILYYAFLFAYTCILFLPSMHERYGFIYEMLAIGIVFLNKKTIPLLVTLTCLSLYTYGAYLYDSIISIRVLSVVNIVTYLLYWYILWKDMKATEVVKN
ncbi:MAG: DUF2029 domain-containing protein [Lachnospiraceae bacterium]|nr:DUF2029 domain-containing protein [Lachnospiraceae bacterium]